MRLVNIDMVVVWCEWSPVELACLFVRVLAHVSNLFFRSATTPARVPARTFELRSLRFSSVDIEMIIENEFHLNHNKKKTCGTRGLLR